MGKKATNGTPDSSLHSAPSSRREDDSTSSSTDSRLLPAIRIVPAERDTVKVNNANLSELKNTCDDAVKRLLSRPDLFKQIHTHTDIRLALGWAGVFVAAGSAFYGWRVEFEQSKPVMWVGLVVYIILTLLQTLYVYFVEGNTIFVGKRKTFDKRIVTERITLSSRTLPSSPEKPPRYSVTIAYVRSSSGGKSLLARGRTADAQGYNAFFDSAGTMDQDRFDKWIAELIERVMEGGAE